MGSGKKGGLKSQHCTLSGGPRQVLPERASAQRAALLFPRSLSSVEKHELPHRYLPRCILQYICAGPDRAKAMFSIPDDAMFSLFDARYLKRDDPVSVFYDDKNESGWYTAKVESVVATGVKVKYTKDNSRELVRWDTPGTTATTRIRLPPSTSAMDQDESKRDNGDGGGGGRRGKCKDAVDASINSLLGELRTFEEKNICDSLANLYVSKLRRRNPERDCTFDKRTLDFKRY